MRCTLDVHTLLALAMPRELQCVALAGVLSSVATTTASMRALSNAEWPPRARLPHILTAPSRCSRPRTGAPASQGRAGLARARSASEGSLAGPIFSAGYPRIERKPQSKSSRYGAPKILRATKIS
jgi:hypothetical protein